MSDSNLSHPEFIRLQEASERKKHWRRWGTYLAERQWGTVREDYSDDGSCWTYFTYETAISRAYRWGEDGLLGWTDRRCRLCFAPAFWNGRDPFLKERLFGLTGPEGNHGEDVKECYFYLNALPSHAYQKALYKYPQNEFPYALLREENRRRGKGEPEFELLDTGIFDNNEYFDCFVEYGKEGPNDILIRLTIHNRAAAPAKLFVLPSLWFRNAWSWGRKGEGYWERPEIALEAQGSMLAVHDTLGDFRFLADPANGPAKPLFTHNETNFETLFEAKNGSTWTKDAFHRYVVHGEHCRVNPEMKGTKATFLYELDFAPGEAKELRFRLTLIDDFPPEPFGASFENTFSARIEETKSFYELVQRGTMPEEAKRVMEQAYAGLIWSKQFYWYSVNEWLEGDPTQPEPSPRRKHVRNTEWRHLYNRDILSMPDKWEYPWYAAWDLAFHMLPMCKVDPDFAKDQLLLLLREWYMHPNGQMPAYEFAFSDVNPPVHAWACWRVYKMTAPRGKRDTLFLARAFSKLMVNFTWWVNRQDLRGCNLFSGGFLGLDNIGVFERSSNPPIGHYLEQADATAWMAFYCGTMLSMACELALEHPEYEDVASKFFEHFIHITDAMNSLGGTGLWNEEDGFYFDMLHLDHRAIHLQIHSLVGIIPLFAAEVFDDEKLARLPEFSKRAKWFLRNRRDLARYVSYLQHDGQRRSGLALLALPSRDRLERVLKRILDEKEFLSPYGIRSLSKLHQERPYVLRHGNEEHVIAYEPGDSTTGMFGGNSNWRGPVWFPINFLLIEALQRYYYFYGEEFKIECPTGSGNFMNLRDVALELARRLSSLFLPREDGGRPCYGERWQYLTDPHWKDLVLFHENFHGETGKGLGASHQTGWTSLVNLCMEKLGKKNRWEA